MEKDLEDLNAYIEVVDLNEQNTSKRLNQEMEMVNQNNKVLLDLINDHANIGDRLVNEVENLRTENKRLNEELTMLIDRVHKLEINPNLCLMKLCNNQLTNKDEFDLK